MNLAIPIGLLLHMLSQMAYYVDFTNEKAHSFGWGTFFHASWALVLAYFLTVVIFKRRLTYFDKQFLCIDGLYSLIIGIAFVLNYYSIIEHTYGLFITATAIGLTTIMITFSAIRHGLFKN